MFNWECKYKMQLFVRSPRFSGASPKTGLRRRLSRIHAVEEQDEQDEVRQMELSPNGEGLFLMPHPLFHPVNPVKIQYFDCIVPAKGDANIPGRTRLLLTRHNGGGFPLFRLTLLQREPTLLAMQLTIEIPDDQASRLGVGRQGTQQLIARIIAQLPKLAVVDELIEFLGCGPQPEQIVAFQVSQDSQSRVRNLLDKSRAGALNKAEESELNAVESLNHLFGLIKARVWQYLPMPVYD